MTDPRQERRPLPRGTADTIERRLGRIVGAGVIAAVVLLASGLALGVLDLGAPIAARLLHAGLVTLMITPALCVVTSIVGFVRERDWIFACATLGVLLVLAGSLWLALRA